MPSSLTVTPPTKVEEPEEVEEELEGEEGLEGEGEGEIEGEQLRRPTRTPRARAAAKSPARARTRLDAPLPSGRAGLDARPARRRVSGTPAASTRERATTSGTWSATSSPADTAPRSARSSQASSPSSGSTAARVALLKPQTYMNESGRSVGAAVRFFKLPPEQLLVVHDEVDLELGRLQARMGGGLAGHNGLRSVAQHLRHPGVRAAPHRRRAARSAAIRAPWRTGCSRRSRRRSTLTASSTRGAEAVEAIVREGLEEAQRRFNERWRTDGSATKAAPPARPAACSARRSGDLGGPLPPSGARDVRRRAALLEDDPPQMLRAP